jgi:peroxiredoxin
MKARRAMQADRNRSVTILLLLVAVILGWVAGAQPSNAKVVNTLRAPDFTLKTHTGNNWRLSEQVGKPVLLLFWSEHCRPCQKHLQAAQALWERYAPDGLEVVAISLDPQFFESAAAANRVGARFPILTDPEALLAERYELTRLPFSVLVNRDGDIADTMPGAKMTNPLLNYEQALMAVLK